jgi:predicted O-linked N-acetylglucosamine transferase (SPINDLY family)
VTFGCFNAMAKLNDRCWELWARILNAVPGSRLYLKNSSLASDDPREPLRARFAAAGGDPSRLLLDGYAASHAGHLAAYNLVDVALDSFPYNGTTTTYDALWMGAPVVALAGSSHASRVGASILNRAGHPEWLASTPEEYVDIAVRLADRSRHAHRERLLPAGMLDGASFTRSLEAAYLDMLNTAEQG